jgi:hypothetical protein
MTPEQRARALAMAAEARSARSALLADVKAGRVRPERVFARDDDVAKKTRVAQVLRALPGYGTAKVAATLAAAGIDEKRRVGGLTAAQRARLCEALAG